MLSRRYNTEMVPMYRLPSLKATSLGALSPLAMTYTLSAFPSWFLSVTAYTLFSRVPTKTVPFGETHILLASGTTAYRLMAKPGGNLILSRPNWLFKESIPGLTTVAVTADFVSPVLLQPGIERIPVTINENAQHFLAEINGIVMGSNFLCVRLPKLQHSAKLPSTHYNQ